MTSSKAEYRRSDYSMARVRSDAAYTQWVKSPRMESVVDRAVGVALIGVSAFGLLYAALRFI